MKIIIHPITYILILITFLCGKFNYFIIISSILIIHDLGHILCMKINNIKINEIIILPFGSIIKSDMKLNEKTIVKIIISSAGILSQIILLLIIYILNINGKINQLDYLLFIKYNKIIFFFNILPIIPLDGSKTLLSILEIILPYKKSIYVTCYISILFTIVLTIKNNININLIMIIVFLFQKTYQEIINININYNKFLLERYLKDYSYKKIKYINSINNLYKNKLNFINNINEKKYLNNYFK